MPTTAYTLAFAGIFALLIVTLWTVAAALINRIGRFGCHAGWLALLAPVLGGVTGTLEIVARAGRGEWGFSPRPPDWPIDGVAGDVLYGIANVLTQSPDLPASFPGATGNKDGAAFLSPFAALASGDLAPSVTTLPIMLLAIAVATGIVVASTGGERRWPYAGLVALGGLAAGMMSASATWGLAIPAAITGSAIVIHVISTRPWDRPWLLARDIVLHLAAMLAIAVIAFLPFRAGYVVTERNTVTGELLTIRELVITGGAFLLFVVAYLVTSATHVLDGARQEGLAGRITAVATIATAVAGTLAGMWLDSAAVLLMTVLLLVIIAAWHRMEQPVHLLLLALTAMGAGIMVTGPLVPMPAGPFGDSPAPEMTAAVWVILGLAAAVIIAWLVDRLGTPGHRVHALAGSVLVTGGTILLVGMLAAPVMTTSVLTGSATTTGLDATAFLETTDDPQASAADRAAAQWLMDTIEGTPVILEAPGWDHQYGGRISAMTGLPAVIGWSTPERFTRPGWEQLATQRQEAARRIYESLGTFESIEPLLRQYDVRLIYVGPLERAAYDDMALAKFERAAESGQLGVVYEADGVVIYEYPGPGAGREEGRP